MNFDEIRSLNDEQLKKYLSHISKNRVLFCSKCGQPLSSYDRKTISASVYDKKAGQKSRVLCNLCYTCYVNLLDFLEVNEPNYMDEKKNTKLKEQL